MVDAEIGPDLGPGVDIDTGQRMRHLRHHPRENRDAQPEQLVRHPLMQQGRDGRVAEDDLAHALGRRVAVEDGLYVGREEVLDVRDAVDESHRQIGSPSAGSPLALRRLEAQAMVNLLLQQVVNPF